MSAVRKLSDRDVSNLQESYRDLINYHSDDPGDPIDPMTYRDSGGDSLLHIAAYRDDRKVVDLLLSAGMDPNLLGDMGRTPLHIACSRNHKAIAQSLMQWGAATDIVDEFGERPDLSEW